MTEKTKDEIIAQLLEKKPQTKRIYKDPQSEVEFEINVPLNLTDIIKAVKPVDELRKKYSNFVINGQKLEISGEVIDMCYRCSIYVSSPKLEIEDWIFLSTERADLIIAINAEIADMMISGISNLGGNVTPLQLMNSINL